MSYTLIDYFKAFHTLKEQLKLSAGSQAVYISLLGEFNAARFPERISLSDRALKALAGLKSVATAHECKNVLKNKGLINFTSSNGVTSYQLATEHLPNTYRTLTEHLPNSGGSSYIRAREDVKTLDSSICCLSAREREKFLELDALLEYWDETLKGGKLSFEHQGQIAAWLEQHGFEWLKAAMREASDANGNNRGLSFKLFRAVVENKLNPPKKPELRVLKGGAKSGQREHKYEQPPEYAFLDEWEREAANSVK